MSRELILRRALLRKFPYGVFYVIEQERIVVVAILHTARSLDVWIEREQVLKGGAN